MENDFRNAMNKIQADTALKDSTARFLREKINGRGKARPYFKPAAGTRAHPQFRHSAVGIRSRSHFRLASVGLAAVLLVFFFLPNAYVDMDVNPSIGLTLNRLGLVIDARAYNSDGAEVLNGSSVRFKTYDEAADILLNTVISKGYLDENGLVSVTVQAGGNIESDMLTGLNQTVEASLSGHHVMARSDVYAVTDELRVSAHEHHVTPAKYLAINGLLAVDPAATFEGCMGHSISELQELTKTHGHSGESGTDGSDTSGESGLSGGSSPTGGHHGETGHGHN